MNINTPLAFGVMTDPQITMIPINNQMLNISSQVIITPSPRHLNHQKYANSPFPSMQDEVNYNILHAKKLKDVRYLLNNKVNNSEGDRLEGFVMVDALQRLGIDHHFREEIDTILEKEYSEITSKHAREHQDLYEVSLCFRLSRQQGYHVSPDHMFKNFKDEEEKFEAELIKDVRGLMGLYEASQLRTEGEFILDEAANFSSNILKEIVTFLDPHEARMVRNTLENSYQNCPSSFRIRNFLKQYSGTIMQELAEMEFTMLQAIHNRELLQICRWWKDLGLAEELKFARDQPEKWYLGPMVALTDPTMSEQRIELTKPISLIYIIDDIFDVYGSLDELTLFTEAVNRWDNNAIEHLPDYMKICFKALHDITCEIGDKIYKKHGFNPIDFLRKSWTTLCDAFLVEARWFASKSLPTSEEYLRNGIVSTGIHVVLVHMFFLLGCGPTEESASLIDDNQGIINSVATILRLWDDLGSAQDEHQDGGHDGSYLNCYIKEHPSSSVQTAREHIVRMISDTWKRLNRECLPPNPYSATFTQASLNIARMVPLMYNYDDNHSLPCLKEHIKSMFCDGFQITRESKML